MISKEFINYLSNKTKISNTLLIEKDAILNQLLYELANDNYFKDNFVFKGGTCLIKCYLGYYRFSEDLDFSWISQSIFNGMSEKQIRKFLSKEINYSTKLLFNISQKHGFIFSATKQDKQFIEFGGSNKFVTFKLWYLSSILGTKQFVKIQINFVETFKFGYKEKPINMLLDKADKKEISFLFPQYAYLFHSTISLAVYDPREILIEKVRAILTRKDFKTRDFIDLYLLYAKLGYDYNSYKHEIIAKITFMLKYEKYSQNLKGKNIISFKMKGEEEKLLLLPLPGNFNEFMKKLIIFLDKLLNDLLEYNGEHHV